MTASVQNPRFPFRRAAVLREAIALATEGK